MKLKINILSFSKDFILNICASLISTGVMQIILYPALANKLSSSDYGMLLTVMGLINVITLAFGNNLCNARLITREQYEKENLTGDFQILVILMSCIASVLVIIINFYFKLGNGILLGLIAATVLTILKSYYLVIYRLEIDYVKNLKANILICIGYLIGGVILINYLKWPWIFAFASLMGLVYIFYSSPIIKEPLTKTILFKKNIF